MISSFTLSQGAANETPGDAKKRVRLFQKGQHKGHYPIWEGRHQVLIGDSATQAWMECGNNFDQKAYVDALSGNNLNLLMIWSYIGTNALHQLKDERIGYDAPEIWPWAGSIDRQNLNMLEFNQAYFDRLKALVEYAEEKGIIVLVTVHDGGVKWRFNEHPFNAINGNGPLTDGKHYVELFDYTGELTQNYNHQWSWRKKNQYFQERFCEKLIAELYHFPNVIYEIFNEGNQYDSSLRNLHEQHFLAFFRKRCDNLLITNSDHIENDLPHHDTKVDMISYHGSWTKRHNEFAEAFFKNPPKPYILSEPVPAYKGEDILKSNNFFLRKKNIDIDLIRRSVWEITLAGAGWINQNDTSFGWDSRSRISSQKEDRIKSYFFVGHCAKFLNKIINNLESFQPLKDFSSTGICLGRKGVEYIVYAPRGGSISINLSSYNGDYQLKWFNPREGNYIDSGHATAGGSKFVLVAPNNLDWVLHVRRRQ